jgi:threonine dehydrogenase-like Zn-dependent dehydrogenase
MTRRARVEDLVTPKMPLDESPHGYEIYRIKQDSAIKVLSQP